MPATATGQGHRHDWRGSSRVFGSRVRATGASHKPLVGQLTAIVCCQCRAIGVQLGTQKVQQVSGGLSCCCDAAPATAAAGPAQGLDAGLSVLCLCLQAMRGRYGCFLTLLVLSSAAAQLVAQPSPANSRAAARRARKASGAQTKYAFLWASSSFHNLDAGYPGIADNLGLHLKEH